MCLFFGWHFVLFTRSFDEIKWLGPKMNPISGNYRSMIKIPKLHLINRYTIN